MTNRNLSAVAVLVIAAALTAACGDDAAESPRAATPAASASPAAPASVPGGAPGGTGAPSTATTPAAPPTGPAGPSAPERRPASPPPVQLPVRPTGTPGARQVVDAFRAAGLKVPNPRDRSVDCGPDGLGLGCSELIATDAVTVYVFPDPSSASDVAETWGGQSFRHGAVVLNYLEARTPAADRARYEKVLTGLR
ncbi:hypothetical protein GA0070606_1725 [Micromonospora citrea]|uniref:Uncharacterized protein n=1 Tax=Micromonospora citrea TaxID=47855 RepID=A0A1C6UAK7_9ACTN|nr:hypothetical protein [Micromonospora citrea]SCL50994.1 hypothetical protein GA0070606_1725 [Micromonospora citrea]